MFAKEFMGLQHNPEHGRYWWLIMSYFYSVTAIA
jgi:hypothetical protein